jgi:hypothetical protein
MDVLVRPFLTRPILPRPLARTITELILGTTGRPIRRAVRWTRRGLVRSPVLR